ncbi:MAG TPA: fumarylacetoacetate hydrolase family protein [Ramlibacter sp.]|nr:fumarylacetoacetate hydrolase family protein [Ramlibacter sp.]
MRLLSYVDARGTEGFGAVSEDGSTVSDLRVGEITSMQQALAQWGVDGLKERARPARAAARLDEVEVLPPIPRPGKILCVGFNYAAHTAEVAQEQPQHPAIFTRFPESLVAHGRDLRMPEVSSQFDYEAELAVVIGAPAYRLSEADAWSAVAGYACLAENSVRDWQKHSRQATAGKNFFQSGAWGPWLVTADEIEEPEKLEVIGRLNGREVQRDHVGHMVFSIPRIISYISTFIPLAPGDVIATGTPAGVGVFQDPPRYLRPGDVFEVEIPRVGLLRNRVGA